MSEDTAAARQGNIALTDHVTRSDASTGESSPGDYLILDLDSGRYYGVGEVGGFIWENLEGDCDLRAISRQVGTHFDVDAENAEADLIEFVTWLLEVGLAMRVQAS